MLNRHSVRSSYPVWVSSSAAQSTFSFSLSFQLSFSTRFIQYLHTVRPRLIPCSFYGTDVCFHVALFMTPLRESKPEARSVIPNIATPSLLISPFGSSPFGRVSPTQLCSASSRIRSVGNGCPCVVPLKLTVCVCVVSGHQCTRTLVSAFSGGTSRERRVTVRCLEFCLFLLKSFQQAALFVLWEGDNGN